MTTDLQKERTNELVASQIERKSNKLLQVFQAAYIMNAMVRHVF